MQLYKISLVSLGVFFAAHTAMAASTSDKKGSPASSSELLEDTKRFNEDIHKFLADQIRTIDPYTAEFLIQIFKGMPRDQWSHLNGLKNQLVEGIPPSNVSTIFNLLSSVPPSERISVAILGAQLFTPAMSIIQRELILNMLKRISSAERSLRVARGLLFMRGVPRESLPERLNAILISPLVKRIPPLPADQAALAKRRESPYAAGGINIHERDSPTAEAFRLLWKHQGALSSAVVEANFEGFLKYLGDLPENESTQKAKRGLSGLQDTMGGGPLPVGERYTTAQELMARLWLFANTGSAIDQMHKKEGVIRALERSCSICNQGKVQYLATGVLQGYLEGVNIDGAAADASAPHGEPIPMITSMREIEEYLGPLIKQFDMHAPRSVVELFDRTFEYLCHLRMGQVPGKRQVILDPREVVYFLRMGGASPELSLAAGDGTFRVDDYEAQYAERDASASSAAAPTAGGLGSASSA